MYAVSGLGKNAPGGAYGWGILVNFRTGTDAALQTYVTDGVTETWRRTRYGGKWSSWMLSK